MSDPQFQYSHMPHTQVQYTEQRAYVQPPIWARQHITSAQTLTSPRNIPQPTQHTTNHHCTKPPTIHMGTSLQTPNFLFTSLIHNPPIRMTTAIVPKWNLTPTTTTK